MGRNQRRKELVTWRSVANVEIKNIHKINKVLENNISDDWDCAIVDSVIAENSCIFEVHLHILLRMKAFV